MRQGVRLRLQCCDLLIEPVRGSLCRDQGGRDDDKCGRRDEQTAGGVPSSRNLPCQMDGGGSTIDEGRVTVPGKPISVNGVGASKYYA